MLINDDSGSPRLVRVYGEQEQYPLGADRYYRNLPNLFLDVIDLLDGNDPLFDEDPEDRASDATKGNSISLKTLTQRADHAAADGSGNARRFKDARALWALMSNHVENRVRKPDDDPIVDVRRNRNWKKNQPMRNVPADPDAWFVAGVYSRANQMRDPFTVYRGLDALFEALLSELDETAAPNLVHARDAMRVNLDYPTYAELAAVLDDSNMLVFHSDQSLADWIREQGRQQEAIHAETPVQVRVIPDPVIDEDDPRYLPADSTMTAAHLANVIAPRE
ncbi:hypothetical protein Uis1B_1736 [Bifidobacterium margollesii]|uniref:Uncharacterized protein n=1 Tax=Bifidobacterium margollesii TaxID=2020964 RepID=A0A2N5J8B0_9BIFI|nr:hypothetical protein Uis1B_1736 [Bifidobacterium margollesii]